MPGNSPLPFHLTGHVPTSPASVLVPAHVVTDFRARMIPVGSRGCIVLRPLYGERSWKPIRHDRYVPLVWRDVEGVRHTILAHRLALALEIGPIPEGVFACHRCDVKACVAHSYAGDRFSNAADRARAERARRLGLPPTLHPMRGHRMVCAEVRA